MSIRRRNHRAFTLVELAMVILILGILAGVAAPRFIDFCDDCHEATATTIVTQMTDQVSIRAVDTGRFPDAILPEWFQNRRLPENPYNTFGVPDLVVVRDLVSIHPVEKVLTETSAGAIWYNQSNGAVRMLVPAQETKAETLSLYNRINKTSTPSLISGTSQSVGAIKALR